jgi:hypothetical protein
MVTKIQKQKFVLNETTGDKFRLLFSSMPSAPYMPDYADNERVKNENVRLWALACRKAMVPGLSVPEIKTQTPYLAVTDFEPKLEFNNLTVEYMIDETFYTYHMMLFWMLMKKHPEYFQSGIDQSYKEGLFVTASLIILDNHNAKAAEFTFYDLHPIRLDDVELNFQDSENLYTGVEFAYSYFLPSNNYEISF